MADFFKYVGKADRGIQDWSKIGKDISDGLKEVTDQRQAERARIDKLTSDAVNEVNNVQLGQNKTFNQFLLNGSGQTKEFLLMQEKLLKQGVLKPQDYLNSRQIVSDDWANLSEAAKSFNTDYAESMSRLQDGKAAMQELYQNEKYDAFMNVQDKDVFINPVDGRMYLTTTDGDGNIERDPASMLNVNSINARRKDKINKFNVQAEVQKATGALGEVVKALNADGVITRTDKRLNEMMLIGGVETTFDDAKNDIIDSLMTSPRNNASILTDDVGGYTFTEVESEAGGKVIYLKENGMGLLEPQLNDEQLGVVRNNLDMEIEKQLGFKETSSYKVDKNIKLQRERLYKPDADKKKETARELNLLGDLFYGSEKEIDVALENLRGIKTNMGVITKIRRSPTQVEITTEGYDPVVFEFGNKTAEEFVESISSEFGINFKDAVAGASLKARPLNKDITKEKSRTKATTSEEKAQTSYLTEYQKFYDLNDPKGFATLFGITMQEKDGDIFLVKGGKGLTGKINNTTEDLMEAINANITGKDKLSAFKLGVLKEVDNESQGEGDALFGNVSDTESFFN